MNPMNLEGKVALVSGGTVRVGRVISLALARAGADIAATWFGTKEDSLKFKEEVEALGRKCLIFEANQRDIPSLKAAVDAIDREFGRLDILIHNASNFNEGPMETVTEEVWDSSHEIILKGAFFLSQAAVPLMMKNGGGRIMAMIGDSYYENWPIYIPHSIAKVGLVKLMELLAVTLSPHIQCTALCPATIMTSAGGDYAPVFKDKAGSIKDNKDISTVEINGRELVMGNPEQVAELIVFLSGCSSYMNGAVIPIDGGKHLV